MEYNLILGIGTALCAFGIPVVAWFRIEAQINNMGK
jgi:hypothetical protein